MRSEPMVIQAVRLAFFGALIAGIALAAGGSAPASAEFLSGGDRCPNSAGDDAQTRLVVELSPQDRPARLYSCRSIPGRRRHPASHVSAAAKGR